MLTISLGNIISLLFLAGAGITAWIRVEIKLAKLETRMDIKDDHLERIEAKLDRLIEQK